MAIAFKKAALASAGGFNEHLEIYEFTELSIRFKGHKYVKTPDLTFLHLEPKDRFTLRGFLRRRMQWGFWHHVLFYLYPRRLSVFAFPVKILLLAAAAIFSLLLQSYIPMALAVSAYLIWMPFHMRLWNKENPTAFAVSRFSSVHEKLAAFVIAYCVSVLADLASEIGKIWAIARSPIRLQHGVPKSDSFLAEG